ncbi:hypothetical protein F2Q68_00028426 [Brassica cretica]|uniref:Autophagy-related protein n=1 Tax=Brassica cretica TaxID=69181 RepID=A0A8S9IJ23_BRACR|nr:hypothetical protein F2Q68_00028426 [Brassica cretica]
MYVFLSLQDGVCLEKRQAESLRIMEKYPDRIHVIVDKAEKFEIPNIDKKKYLSDLIKREILSSVYEEEKDEDGFLYITYSGETTFGASSI